MKIFHKTFMVLLVLAYPLWVFWGINHIDIEKVGAVIIVLAVLRLLFDKKPLKDSLGGIAIVVIVVGLTIYGVIHENANAFRYYPVLVSASFLILFSASLWQKQTIIERIARLQEPDFPDAAITYTRKVTIAWCGFFIVNGSIAAWTAIAASWETWTLYNGCISYILMGLMFSIEWLIRRRVKRNHA